VSEFVRIRYPQLLAAALCLGLATANLMRVRGLVVLVLAAFALASAVVERGRLAVLIVVLFLAGWWWGSARLDVIDRSPLSLQVGTAGRLTAVATASPRRGRFTVRQQAVLLGYRGRRVREPVLLELPRGRAPPQGAIVAALGRLTAPGGPRNGFDERLWLRRRGVHVIVRVDGWRVVGRRGGLGGVADALRRRLRDSVTRGLSGERAAVLAGIVLGEDGGLSEQLRARFRAAGLYHLLAVSGQNVALVAGGALVLAWLLCLPRLAGELGALVSVGAYVLAVGPQPSVVRAGIAGALGSLAWLSARAADRWHFLLVGAIVLLGWSPYALLDAGFQLSFAAVVAIFLLAPRWQRVLEGFPLGRPLRLIVAVSAACGLATAPILWVHFHSVQLLGVPANALAAPAVAPLLGLGLATAAVAPVSAGAAAALAWLNGWCAAYLVLVARAVGMVPFAQVSSTRGLLVLLAFALLACAYALPRWRTSSSPSI
jgi:competence protein ComEC